MKKSNCTKQSGTWRKITAPARNSSQGCDTNSQRPLGALEVYGGIVCRKRTSQNDGHDSLRPYVPESLRLKVLNNYHTSVWGVHRSEKATFREVIVDIELYNAA